MQIRDEDGKYEGKDGSFGKEKESGGKERNNRGRFYMEAVKNAVVDKEGSREGKGDGEEGKGEIWEVDSEWKDMLLGRREVDAKGQ